MKFSFLQTANPNMASWRYRVEAPAKYLKSIGWEDTGKNWWDADIVVMGKHWSPVRDFALINELDRRGMCVAYDICDWHFDDVLGYHYKRMVARADGLIVPTEQWLSMGLPKRMFIAGDAHQSDESPPRIQVSSPLRILWYGHASNLKYLEQVKAPPDAKLEVITSPGKHQYKVYSPETMKAGFEWCDLVIVPSDNPLKSANRVFEAVRQGRFVVSSDLPQYRPCSTCVGSIEDGIEWYRNTANRAEALERLTIAQAVVREQYSPERMGEQWKRALESIYASKKAKAA